MVADLRKATYAHILTLDPAFFLQTRTGEVLSRLTTDIAIVENLLATSVSVALRNLLTLIGALIAAGGRQPAADRPGAADCSRSCWRRCSCSAAGCAS